MSQLESLDIDCAPDLPPCICIDSLKTEDIKKKVTQAVSVHHSWTTLDRMKVARETEIPIPPPEFGQTGNLVEPRVLPGCQEIIVVNCGRLELWSTETKSRIWFLPIYEEYFDCVSFDCELKPGKTGNSKQLVIAAVFSRADILES